MCAISRALLPPPCPVSLRTPSPLPGLSGPPLSPPLPATVLFPRCAHGAAPLAYSGPGLLCCPCVLEQKQTGSMDSDDFRALLISTGYSLVCRLCLPLLLCLFSSPSSVPPPPPSLLTASRMSASSGTLLHQSSMAWPPSSSSAASAGWGPSDDSLSLPPPFLEVSGERRSGLQLSPLLFLFLSFFLPRPPELTFEPGLRSSRPVRSTPQLPTSQKRGTGGAEGARPRSGAGGAVGRGAKTLGGGLTTPVVCAGVGPCSPDPVLATGPARPPCPAKGRPSPTHPPRRAMPSSTAS